MTTANSGGVLTVRVSGETLTLASNDVTEIVRPRGWTRVPNGPPSLLGLANLRGTVLPIVSLASLLGRTATAPSRTQRVIVTGRGEQVGFLVDAVTALSQDDRGNTVDLQALLARDFNASAGKQTAADAPTRAKTIAPQMAEADIALVILQAAGQDYALRLDQVSAILPLPAGINALQGEDAAMLGVTLWRAETLPLVSLAALLGLHPDQTASLRVAVVNLGGIPVGVAACGLDTILRIPRSAIGPVPPVLTRGRGETRLDGICHVDGGKRLISLLSPERLFDHATTRQILATAETRVEPGQGGGHMAEQQGLDGRQEQFVIFLVGGERYGLPIAAVDEVVRRPASLTRVPLAPAFVEGVMNLRGRVIPVINQASRFAVSEGNGAGRRVIIVTVGGLQAGFAVDAVTQILNVPAGTLRTAPGLASGQSDVFDRVALEGESGMTLLIDPAALLDDAEREILASIAANASDQAA